MIVILVTSVSNPCLLVQLYATYSALEVRAVRRIHCDMACGNETSEWTVLGEDADSTRGADVNNVMCENEVGMQNKQERQEVGDARGFGRPRTR